MKRRFSISTRIVFWLSLVIVVFQSTIITLGYFTYKSSNDQSYRKDDAVTCDSMLETFDNPAVGSLFSDVNDVYGANAPGKSISEMSLSERNDYYSLYDSMSKSMIYLNFHSLFLSMSKSAVCDYMTIGYVDLTTSRFVAVFAFSDEDNADTRQTGYYSGIPSSISLCAETGDTRFNGVDRNSESTDLFSSGISLKNAEGYDAWILLDQKRDNVNQSLYLFFAFFAGTAGGVTLLILVSLFIILQHTAIGPTRKLAKEAKLYTDGLKEGKIESVFTKIDGKVDEIGQLNDSFYYLDKELKDYVQKVKDAAYSEEKMKSELELAQRIQQSALPLENINDGTIGIEPFIRPAKEVGGDLFGFEKIDDTHLYFFIGDVSGKGVPAALFMMQAKTLLQENLAHGDLHQAITKTNNRLNAENSEGFFLTAFVAIFDYSTRKLQYVNAAHEPVFLGRNGSFVRINEVAEIPLATLDGYSYHVQEITLEPGDTLFLYTDGVSEAMNPKRELFGRERIGTTLSSYYGALPKDLIEAMIRSIDDYVEGNEQSDDICMLAVSFPDGNEYPLNGEEDLEGIPSFTGRVYAGLLNGESLSKINVALDELASNIVRYGGEQAAPSSILALYDSDNEEAICLLRDHGIPFNPLTDAPERKEGQIGGMGISVARSLVDSVSYRRVGSSNVLIMKKKNA